MHIRVHLQGFMGLVCGLVLLGSFVHPQQCEAATYYVATDGSDANSGTEESRSKRLAEAYRLSVLAILSMLRMERTQVGDFTALPVEPPGTVLLPLQRIQGTRLLLSIRINSLMFCCLLIQGMLL